MNLNVGCRLDLLLRDSHLEVVGTDLDYTQRHKGQMPTDEALLDRAELRFIGLDIDVHILQLADLLTVDIDEHLALPFSCSPLGLTLFVSHFRLLPTT